MNRILEICVTDLASAHIAERGGADRIELCSDLSVGGITPPLDLVRTVIGAVQLPVHVLVRPRDGDFHYSMTEIDQMTRDIGQMSSIGAAGVVSGALDAHGNVDRVIMNALIRAADGLAFTFHRAIDHTRDLDHSLDALAAIGITRILTSGGATTAPDAADRFPQIITRTEGKIEVMAGGGIRPHNIHALLQVEGLNAFHSAASTSVGSGADLEVIMHLRNVLDR